MKITGLMHTSFFTDQLAQIRNFYEDKLHLVPKLIIKYEVYKKSSHPLFSKKAETSPDDIALIFFEVAPGQFLEFFPDAADVLPRMDDGQNHLGYSHISFTVDDIFAVRDDLIKNGVAIDRDISIGSTHTYKMWIHDPDGNKIELMQYTDNSALLQ